MSDNEPQRSSHPVHRPLGGTFYRYVAMEALRPTIIALIGLTVVVLTKDLLGFTDLIINRGLGVSVVARIAFYKAVPIAALMFPFSVLLGCLVAMGRLGTDREILSLEASGVAAARLVWPVIFFAGAMAVISVWLSMQASPWSYRSLDAALESVAREQPWAQIRKGKASRFGGWRVEAREVSSGGDRLRSVLMWMPDLGETIFARSGRLEATDDGSVQIRLMEGGVVLSPSKGPRFLRFDMMTTMLPSSNAPVMPNRRANLKGMTLAELDRSAIEFVPQEGKSLPKAAIEFQRRIATPAATLVFGFLAAPLFLIRGNYSRASGGILGLALTISYYGLVQLGEGLIQSNRVPVTTGVWMANGILAVLALAFLFRALRSKVLGLSFDRPNFAGRAVSKTDVPSGYRPGRYPLPRYIAGRFLQLALLTFSVLLVAYLLIDIMERLDWFARYRAGGLEIVRFYGARIPLLASRVFPMSLLVATALTVSLLAVEGELIGMRSCGIPAPRALLPVLLLAMLAVPAFFILSNVIVPRTNALADELKESEIKEDYYARQREKRKDSVWYRAGEQVLEAERFDPDRGVARGLVIYGIGDGGLPVSRIDAASARHVGQGEWRLIQSRMIVIDGDTVREVPPPRYASLGEALPAKVDTMHLPVAALVDEIKQMEADGYDSTAYRVDLQMKLAQPLACIILPALVLFFAVGGPPFPGPAQNLLVSGIVGVGYILVTGVAASFGYGGTVSPTVGGWGPNIVFLLVAGFFGLRLWRRL